ncbi:MAG: anhydro-N-acetylmuramic acid kinase [Candidatus Eremiobacteraeota bacterium]|nr:anhydro-N-acetylmuramic acid kinase [Candidatus Eremiobacteraeota bacterium]
MIAVGLMSGTSLDGIDAALVEILPRGPGYSVRLDRFLTKPFSLELSAALAAALPPNAGSIAEAATLHRDLGLAFAQAAVDVAAGSRIDYAASHGQTLWHDGEHQATLQAADAFAIRDAVAASVCFDFRSGDCAAGGCGAPLVPYVDAMLLAAPNEDRVAVNLGGIANLTVLPRGCNPTSVVAFDSGPGNMLIDAFVKVRTAGRAHYDAGGAFALAGRVDHALLEAMARDPYFARPFPKSTGRERFGHQFFEPYADTIAELSLEDGAATLAALTVLTLADAICAVAPNGSRVLLSGGGARNEAIVRGLRERLALYCVESSGVMEIDPDAKEAIAFALLGYETLRGRASNVPSATGARYATPLGAIAPWNLRELLAKVHAECA